MTRSDNPKISVGGVLLLAVTVCSYAAGSLMAGSSIRPQDLLIFVGCYVLVYVGGGLLYNRCSEPPAVTARKAKP